MGPEPLPYCDLTADLEMLGCSEAPVREKPAVAGQISDHILPSFLQFVLVVLVGLVAEELEAAVESMEVAP